jgi:hypothetical protein
MAEGAGILAPSALVSYKAGDWAFEESDTSPATTFISSTGQVYLDRSSFIDVAGTTGATAPFSRNFLEVQLRGSELADSPLQRSGALRGQTIRVDLRKKELSKEGTGLALHWPTCADTRD